MAQLLHICWNKWLAQRHFVHWPNVGSLVAGFRFGLMLGHGWLHVVRPTQNHATGWPSLSPPAKMTLDQQPCIIWGGMN